MSRGNYKNYWCNKLAKAMTNDESKQKELYGILFASMTKDSAIKCLKILGKYE